MLCLVLFAALAAFTGSLVDQPEFDLTSGADWSERAAQATSQLRVGASPPSLPLGIEADSPRVASGLILLASGLILTVAAIGVQARRQVQPLRLEVLSAR